MTGPGGKLDPHLKQRMVRRRTSFEADSCSSSSNLSESHGGIPRSPVGSRSSSPNSCSKWNLPNANFALCHSQNSFTGETYLSLRSMDTATDVEVIASKFGGGGHRNAAGISVFGSDTLPGILLDRYQCYNIVQRIKIKTQILIDKETEVNIVYLNSTQHKRHIGAYLLQTRYDEIFEGELREVSEGCSIIRNKIKDASYYIGLDLSCIYFYDDSEDMTYFSVVSQNMDLLLAIKDMYSIYVVDTDDANISKRLKLKFAGYIKCLI